MTGVWEKGAALRRSRFGAQLSVRVWVRLVLACCLWLSAAASAQQEYTIAPGDRISIVVFGEPDLSLEAVSVPANGVISYPLLGAIRVVNHTRASLENHITGLLLDGYLNKPKVSVTVTEYRPIFVNGAVKTPGAHKFTEGLTVEKAIALAGGLDKGGISEGVTLKRESAPAGKAVAVALNTPVQPGDVITIPSESASVAGGAEYVYLYGEVKSPGGFEYRKGLTVEKAVALAGGFTVRASQRKIEISRDKGDGGANKLKGVSLTEPVEPGDVITVGASFF